MHTRIYLNNLPIVVATSMVLPYHTLHTSNHLDQHSLHEEHIHNDDLVHLIFLN